MNIRAILIHGWEEKPEGHWLPWVGEQLKKKGWQVDIPEMPNTKNPKLDEWLAKLESLAPNGNTMLIGHSLANALILKYLEKPNTKIKGAVMVAAWDWLMEDVKEFHETFFESGFDYQQIKEKHVPLIIVNSTTDPWIDIEKAKPMAGKLGAKFVAVENAGHFMDRNGYKEFPQLVTIIENI
jgi:predicted alpha/beta hydrolase family esterase